MDMHGLVPGTAGTKQRSDMNDNIPSSTNRHCITLGFDLAIDEQLAAGNIELPAVPRATQHAALVAVNKLELIGWQCGARDRPAAKRAAIMRAIVQQREELPANIKDADVLAINSHQFALAGCNLRAFANHKFLFGCHAGCA